jgi:hypothetical protein
MQHRLRTIKEGLMGCKSNFAPVTAMCFGFLCTILLTPATAPATKRANRPGMVKQLQQPLFLGTGEEE